MLYCRKAYFFRPLKTLQSTAKYASCQIENKLKQTKLRNASYNNLFPWTTLSEFSEHICSSVVYNKGGLIAINKPYGVKILKTNKTQVNDETVQNIKHSVSYSQQVDFPYSIEETLENLKHHLGVSELTIIKSSERYASGLVIMGTNQKILARVKKSINYCRHLKVPHLVYWAITNHSPVETARREKVGIKFVDIEFKNEQQPVIVTNYSHRDVVHKRLKPYLVEYRCLSVNSSLSTSLIEIATSSTKSHFLRLYASSRIASILGDTLYGSRMRTIFGKPILLNPHNVVAYDVQPLPKEVCDKLSLPETVNGHLMVPTMLHCRTIVLPKFENGQDLLISAPLSPHFHWTCVKLELLHESNELE